MLFTGLFALYNLIGPLHCATHNSLRVYHGAQKLQNRRLILDDRPNLLQNSTKVLWLAQKSFGSTKSPLASTKVLWLAQKSFGSTKMGQKWVRRVEISKTSGSF